MFDVSNKASFEALGKWKKQLIDNLNPPNPEQYPFICVGNKCDLANRAVQEQEARNWCSSNGNILYIETSGLNGTNVEQAFMQVAEKHVSKGQSSMQLGMPTSLGGADGAMQLSAQDDMRRTQ